MSAARRVGTKRIVRAALVGVAVLAAQWLSGAALAPLGGASMVVGGAGPRLSVPWLLAGVTAAGLALMRPNGLLWPWLALALPLAVPAWPAAWLFTGTGSAAVWALVAAAAFWGRPTAAATAGAGARWYHQAIVPALIGVAWLGAASMLVAPHAMTGDAPHYLTITQSLVADGDLDLKNDYDHRTHSAFFAGALEPRHTSLSPWGKEYPFHGVGVSVLVAPAFAIFGAPGAAWTLIVVMAAGAALLWTIVRDLTGQVGAAWFAWTSLLTSAPFTFHAVAIYPDGPAAVGVVGALWLLSRDPLRRAASLTSLAAVGTGLATLPWLHARLALPAGVLGLAAAFVVLRTEGDRWTRLSWLLMVPIISCAGWVAAAYVMFDTWNPAATILARTAPGTFDTVPAGLFGLLFDREFGLLPTSPVFLLAPLGVAPLLARRGPLALAGSAAFVGVAATSSLWVWWGGDSAPARFLTVVLPVAAIALGALWASTSERFHRVLSLALCGSVTATVLMATVDGGAHVYNFPDGRGSIFEAVTPAMNAALALPSMLAPGATLRTELPIALIWLATALLAGMVVAGWPTAARGGDGVAALAVLLMGGVAASAAWAMRGAAAATPATAQHQLVARMASAGASFSGVAVWPPGSPDALARKLALRTPESLTLPREVRLHVPNVPAGTYTLWTTSTDGGGAGTCRLELGRDAWPHAAWNTAEPPPTLRLATAVHSVRVLDCGPSVSDVWMQPMERPKPSATVARRVARLSALDIYALDDATYLDGNGVWTGGDRTVNLLIASAIPGLLRAQLTAGPAAVGVALRHGQSASTLDLEPSATTSVVLGGIDANSPIAVQLGVSGGFPGYLLSEGDSRSLGVWVAFEVTASEGPPR